MTAKEMAYKAIDETKTSYSVYGCVEIDCTSLTMEVMTEDDICEYCNDVAYALETSGDVLIDSIDMDYDSYNNVWVVSFMIHECLLQY